MKKLNKYANIQGYYSKKQKKAKNNEKSSKKFEKTLDKTKNTVYNVCIKNKNVV